MSATGVLQVVHRTAGGRHRPAGVDRHRPPRLRWSQRQQPHALAPLPPLGVPVPPVRFDSRLRTAAEFMAERDAVSPRR
jgi:hypothetical protein